MDKKQKAPSRKDLGEKGVVKQLLGDFNPEGSKGMRFIERYLDKKEIRVNNLKSISTVFSQMCNIHLPRNYTRNKKLLILWFDMNIDRIEPLASNLSLEFEEIVD